jgi:cell fate regulator YaaT (PSP1 superfamily)
MPDNDHYSAGNEGVVGVRFQKVGKVYHFDTAGIEGLKEDDFVIVETARGQELAQVVQVGLEPRPGGPPLKPIARRAAARDMALRQRYKLQEKEALHVCRQKVEELDLSMRIPRVEYSYDGRRLTVYFMADEKVECRALRRELGRHFRARVGLQPVGARDLAKMLGGCGACGGLLCCATFLAEFAPVSIKVAKAQDVTLVPSEITGMCGRLRCCLRYEYQTYKEARQAMPQRGCRVVTRSGRGRVVQINVLKDTVVVDFGTYQAEVPLASLEVEPEGCGRECDPT